MLWIFWGIFHDIRYVLRQTSEAKRWYHTTEAGMKQKKCAAPVFLPCVHYADIAR